MNLSEERKYLQSIGEIPEWFTTGGWQLFKEKYSWKGETVKSRFKTIASALFRHAPNSYPEWWNNVPYYCGLNWGEVFFKLLWDGFIVPPTPLYANGGLPKRGQTVSCSGTYMGNNLYDRYNLMTELAVLTKHSAGTSVDLSQWPARGDKLARGGMSEGIMPIIRDIKMTMNEVAQTSRRGSCAYSVNIKHGDFYDVAKNLYDEPESNNVGWIYEDSDIESLWDKADPESIERFAEVARIRDARGKGYITKLSHMQRALARAFKDVGMQVHASNLCQETNLASNDEYTYSCVLLNYNLHKYDEWPEFLVFVGQVMSDCNVSEYLESFEYLSPQDRNALKRIEAFTRDFRALGSGVMGLATYFQKKGIVWGSLDSFYVNNKIFKGIYVDALSANAWLAMEMGSPKRCKHLGLRNATMLMMPPTKSTAELCYGVSEGINPDAALVFVKQTAGGEIFRVVPEFLKLMKERGVFNEDTLRDIASKKGSAQHVDWLTDEEKKVFRIAFEIDMYGVVRLASQRQKWIDQGQSLNLYFSGKAPLTYICGVYREAMLDENILTLYYNYSTRGGEFAQPEPCEVCT